MPFVRMNPRRELSEFYPPPYNFLAPRLMSVKRGCPLPGCACKRKRGMGQGTSGAISSGAGQAATAVSAYNTLLVGAGIVQSVPVAGQIIGAALAITAVIAGLFKGCGQTCILTTEEVNKIEPYMQQNVQQYLAAPPSPTTQQEALANFNQLWQAVVNYCNQPSMASAGQRCISDRAQGSCKYRTSPGGWQQTGGTWKYVAPGSNGSGTSCWNWFIGYHDPIANDPRPMAAPAPAPAPQAVSAPAGNILGTSAASAQSGRTVAMLPITTGLPGWLLPASLVGIAALLFLGGKR